MIGNELWDRSVFGVSMIFIGGIFAWIIWDKSWVLALVGAANMLFGAYVIWGAFAWRAYKEETLTRHGKCSSGKHPRKV